MAALDTLTQGWQSLKERWRGRTINVATVDVAKAAPPPSPLAPIDLTNESQVTGVMEIAARIGDLLIAAGTSNADTQAQVYLVARSYGLHYCHVSILTNTITMHATIGAGEKRRSLHVFRLAQGIDLNFSKLAAVDKLIRSIHSGATPPAMAERILDEIEKMPPPRGVAPTLVGWGVMGGAFAVVLGGGVLAALITFVVAAIIMGCNTWLGRLRVPVFYQNVIGGFIAVVPAAITYNIAASIGVTLLPAQIIGSGIIVLVAGLTLVQSLVDGITRAPVTSAARFLEAMLATCAIVAGVGAGIQAADYLGFDLPPLETVAPPVYHEVPLLIAASGIGSAAFAYAVYASWKEVTVAGLTAVAGMTFFYGVLVPFGFGTVFSSFIASVAVGLAGGLMARRFYIPPLITMTIGYTPMLPGGMFYRAMYATTNEQMITGFTNLAMALAIAGALAAGVVLGERGARRLRRPQKFRPYTALRRVGRFSYQQASKLAAGARRIPRVPMSPTAPRVNRPLPPPVQGPKPPAPAADVRSKQYEAITEQLDALRETEDLDVMDVLQALDPATETWEAITDPDNPPEPTK